MKLTNPFPSLARGVMAVGLAVLLSACSTMGQSTTPVQSTEAASVGVAGVASSPDGVEARAILLSPRAALPGRQGLGVAYVAASRGPDIAPLEPAHVHHDTKQVVYDSIGATVGPTNELSSAISSTGYNCCSIAELGDGVVFTQGGGVLKTIEVVMDSWSCQENLWYQASCYSAPGSTFAMPITLNVYSVTGYPSGVPTVGQLLTTRTQTFAIKYRPPANTKKCSGSNLGGFIGPVDKECDAGIAQGIIFDLTSPKTVLPAQAIVTVAFNTSLWGYQPYGTNTPCHGASGGCPYDNLDISADGNGALPGEGGNVDPNGVFVNYADTQFYCANNPNGQPPGGTLVLDTPCWAGFHPEIQVITY